MVGKPVPGAAILEALPGPILLPQLDLLKLLCSKSLAFALRKIPSPTIHESYTPTSRI